MKACLKNDFKNSQIKIQSEPRCLIIGIRGLTRSAFHWGEFPSMLENYLPDCLFLPLEIAGNGHRSNEVTPTNPAEVIDDLRMQVHIIKENLNLKNTSVHVLGLSLGGMLALKWAEIYPAEIQSVIIINSSLKQLSKFYHRLLLQNYFFILYCLILNSAELNEKTILKLTSNNRLAFKKFKNEYVEFAKKYKTSRLNFIRQIVLASKIEIIKALPLFQYLVVCSQNDRLVSNCCSYGLALHLSGALIVNPNAGHDLPLDDPDWLCLVLKNHLTSNKALTLTPS